jgi:hypothetical protein
VNERVEPSSGRLRAACCAAVLLALFPLSFWIRIPPRDWLVTPVTPIDRTPSIDPAQWTAVWAVRSMIPEGKGVGVIAPTPDETMTLYMISVAVLTNETVFPRWYFGVDYREIYQNAEYVIAFRCTDPGLANAHRIAQLGDVCLYRRAGFDR